MNAIEFDRELERRRQGASSSERTPAPPAVRLPDSAAVLRQELTEKELQLYKLTGEVMALKQAIAILGGASPDELPVLQSTEYRDLGITASARRYLREAGEPQDTRTIADALLRRGLQTNSKNFIATIYATLNNGKTWFRRTADGRWELKLKDLDAADRSRKDQVSAGH